jgi:hypothetical protein
MDLLVGYTCMTILIFIETGGDSTYSLVTEMLSPVSLLFHK